jgi:hypothetical protein
MVILLQGMKKYSGIILRTEDCTQDLPLRHSETTVSTSPSFPPFPAKFFAENCFPYFRSEQPEITLGCKPYNLFSLASVIVNYEIRTNIFTFWLIIIFHLLRNQ